MEHLIGVDLGGWLDRGVTLVVAVVIALVVQRVVVRLMHKALDASNLPSASIFINIVRALIWALALLGVLQPVFGVDPAGFVAALGVVSLAVSLGMQDTISNIVSGISLMVSKSVQPGDFVTVGRRDRRGDRRHLAQHHGAHARRRRGGYPQLGALKTRSRASRTGAWATAACRSPWCPVRTSTRWRTSAASRRPASWPTCSTPPTRRTWSSRPSPLWRPGRGPCARAAGRGLLRGAGSPGAGALPAGPGSRTRCSGARSRIERV